MDAPLTQALLVLSIVVGGCAAPPSASVDEGRLQDHTDCTVRQGAAVDECTDATRWMQEAAKPEHWVCVREIAQGSLVQIWVSPDGQGAGLLFDITGPGDILGSFHAVASGRTYGWMAKEREGFVVFPDDAPWEDGFGLHVWHSSKAVLETTAAAVEGYRPLLIGSESGALWVTERFLLAGGKSVYFQRPMMDFMGQTVVNPNAPFAVDGVDFHVNVTRTNVLAHGDGGGLTAPLPSCS